MYAVALKAPSLGRITLIVTAIHFLILVGSMWQIDQTIQPSPTRLVVHTVISSPSSVLSPTRVSPVSLHEPLPLQEIALQEVPAVQEEERLRPKHEAPKSEASKKVPVVPVKEVPKQPVPKAVKKPDLKLKTEAKTEVKPPKKELEKKSTPNPVESKKGPSLDKKMLQELRKGLQDAHALDTQAPVTAPSTLSPLSLSQPSSNASVAGVLSAQAEEDYISQLKGYLQSSLRLPDVGEVTIGLRLTAQGRVVEIDVLKTTSKLNEQYVLDHVPILSFPAWGKGAEEKYFPVTLRSK